MSIDVKKLRTDYQIRSPEVRLIDADGKMLGVFETKAAIRRAKEAGLELVEISPTASPPVCKITELGKLIYEKQKKQKGSSNAKKMKEIKFKICIGEHDFMIKMKHVSEFIQQKHQVKVTIELLGRGILDKQTAGHEWAKRVKETLADLKANFSDPKMAGRRIQFTINPL